MGMSERKEDVMGQLMAAHSAVSSVREQKRHQIKRAREVRAQLSEESRDMSAALHAALWERTQAARRAVSAGIPKRELAQAMGVSSSMMTFILNGER